jgi:hypothetical protein
MPLEAGLARSGPGMGSLGAAALSQLLLRKTTACLGRSLRCSRVAGSLEFELPNRAKLQQLVRAVDQLGRAAFDDALWIDDTPWIEGRRGTSESFDWAAG